MLLIRNSQIEAFRRNARSQFEDFAVRHVFECFPDRCSRLGEGVVRDAVRFGFARAGGHGFTLYRTTCIYVTAMFWLGSRFDEDPAIPWAARILANPSPELERAAVLQDAVLNFLDSSEGAENEHLERMVDLVRTTPLDVLMPATTEEAQAYIAGRLRWLHPRKCEAVGEDALKRLVQSGIASANSYGFGDPQQQGLYVTIMLLLGSGFDRDPLLPWAQRVLHDCSAAATNERGARLHRAGMAYLRAAMKT